MLDTCDPVYCRGKREPFSAGAPSAHCGAGSELKNKYKTVCSQERQESGMELRGNEHKDNSHAWD